MFFNIGTIKISQQIININVFYFSIEQIYRTDSVFNVHTVRILLFIPIIRREWQKDTMTKKHVNLLCIEKDFYL
jgi:hypothetical protein